MGDNTTAEDAPFPLTEADKWILSQTDEEFKYHDWANLKDIIEANNLSALKRKPSDLRRYMDWTAATKAEYGSMTAYLLQNRLPKAWGRLPFTPVSDIPFADPSDYRVLKNDWPYGLTPGITHIVVWSRTTIPTEPVNGDVTPESRQLIRDFVKTHFVDKLGPGGEDRVMWFKNWVSLQSVRALEHIHVLVKDVDASILEEWTKEHDFHM
ncbi:hypothetical protein BD289DRAFT_369494 [Coniella lustricola]|uniref:N-acetylglucosamine-induced protein 1 n=1 Tax=Coniella lustricola TaxID=2025994 RepID=A0A2T3A6G9_9PEZI|nr:hypothetical protein BD289DRAFT_369494 [Coniella lustricola]